MIDGQLLPPIHPGEILLEEFLEPMKLSQYRLAHDIGVPPRRINEICQIGQSLALNFWAIPSQSLTFAPTRATLKPTINHRQ